MCAAALLRPLDFRAPLRFDDADVGDRPIANLYCPAGGTSPVDSPWKLAPAVSLGASVGSAAFFPKTLELVLCLRGAFTLARPKVDGMLAFVEFESNAGSNWNC